MSIKANLETIYREIPDHVQLVAVSKTKPVEDIMEAYRAGHRVFGENKAQELIAKQPELPEDIRWHYIGHLQSNKVKYLAPFVSLIHSLDRQKLIKEVNKEAGKNNRIIEGLLQFHIAEEDSKFGLSLDEAREILASDAFRNYNNIRITGVMGMATYTSDKAQIQKEFQLLKQIFTTLKAEFFHDKPWFKDISAGMSGDYKIAIEESSTIIRLGSVIFGQRN